MAKKRGKKGKKYNRLSADEARKRSSTTRGSSGNWFQLPEGVSEWRPEKTGRMNINILPYVTSSEKHPCGVEPDTIWYMYPFQVHHGVGSDGKSLVCPKSIGKHCPICEEVARLSKDYDENEALIKELRAQRFVAYNIEDPRDSDNVAIFALSVGKFQSLLEQEIRESDDPNIANFFNVDEDGKTLSVRFSETSYGGTKYLTATKMDFKERDEMDEEEVLEQTVCLDEMFVVMEYDKIKEAFLEIDSDSGAEKSSKKKPPKTKKPLKGVDVEEDDSEEDEFDDDDFDDDEDWGDEEDEEPKKSKSKPKPKKTTSGKKKSGKKSMKKKEEPEEDEEDDFDDDDFDDDDFDDDEEEKKSKPKKSKKSSTSSKKKFGKKKEEPEEDDDFDDDEDWGDEEDEEIKPSRKKKSNKKQPKSKKPASKSSRKKKKEDDDDDDGWDDEEDEFDDDDDDFEF